MKNKNEKKEKHKKKEEKVKKSKKKSDKHRPTIKLLQLKPNQIRDIIAKKDYGSLFRKDISNN